MLAYLRNASTPIWMLLILATGLSWWLGHGPEAADAISAQLAEHWAAKEKGLQAALQGPEVTALLETARFTEKQRSAS